jgi:DNA-binding transcriptional regulator YhcF (GntR family)
MDTPYVGMWSLMYETIRAFWALTEPRIEQAARANNIPTELYYYGELGLDIFSLQNFGKRDPYSNPATFQLAFEKLEAEQWIQAQNENEYRVTERAREAAREIVRVGDEYLGTLEVMSAADAEFVNALLQRLVAASLRAPEPPEHWASIQRLRVADGGSPQLAQIREGLMDLFAYRDDSHRSAWRGYPVSGIAWNAFGMIWNNTAFSPEQMAEQAWFRGYAAQDYARALAELRTRGWIYDDAQLTPIGKKLRDAVEQLTDAYFYAPWLVLRDGEIQELRVRLLELRNQLSNVTE